MRFSFLARRWALLCLAVLIAIITLAAYWQTWHVGFVGDDYYFLHTTRTFDDVIASFSGDWFWHRQDFVGARYYRPLQITLFYLEHQWLYHNWSAGYHATNLLIHLLNSLGVGLLVLILLQSSDLSPPYRRLLALGAALLFAIHPRHAEAVCMINGRTDSLCALFYLASLIAYLGSRNQNRRWLMALSLASYALALLSKEMAITLPMVLLLAEWSRAHRANASRPYFATLWHHFRATLPHWVVMLIIFAGVRTWALGGYLFGKNSYLMAPEHGFILYFYSLNKVLWVLLFPFDSWIDPIAPEVVLFANENGGNNAILGVIVYLLVLVSLLGWNILRGNQWLTIALSLWFLASAPILSAMNILDSKIGDRYLYIPSIGFCLMAGWFAYQCLLRKRVGAIALTLAAAFWLGGAWQQLRTEVAEWQVAGQTAQEIRRQIEAIETEHSERDRFALIGLPAFFRGKTIQNTALGTYLYREIELRRQGGRTIMPLLSIYSDVHPQQLSTQTSFQDSEITHQVEGGFFGFTFPFAQEWVTLQQESYYFGVQTARFSLSSLKQPTVFLAYDQGNIIQVPKAPPKQADIIAAQGHGGATWVHHYPWLPSPDSTPQQIKAQVQGVVSRLKHDPWRGVHLSTGDLNQDEWGDFAASFMPTVNPNTQFPALILAYSLPQFKLIAHPFTPFPRESDDILENPYGEVRTAIGRFIPGEEQPQLACATGHGGQQVIRLYQTTGQPQPHGWKIVAQVRAFDEAMRPLNANGGVTLSAGDLTGDGLDELVVGQTNSPTSQGLVQVLAFKPLDEDGLAWLAHRSPLLQALAPAERLGGGVNHAIGDLDGDGKPEIIAASQGAGTSESTPAPSKVMVHRPEIQDNRVIGFTEGATSLTVFSNQENPTGAVSIASGNLDYEVGDELVVGTSFPPGVYSQDQIAQIKQENPRPLIKTFKPRFDESGVLHALEPLEIAPQKQWRPFLDKEEAHSVSVDVEIINR